MGVNPRRAMMPTEIIPLDLRDAPAALHVRADVQGVLIVVCDDHRPVGLMRMPRPPDGILATRDVLTSYRARAARAAVSPGAAVPVSVIVCTHERPDDLARCLESLATAARDGDETIVVDNCPGTGRTAEVAARFRVRYVIEPARGLDRARNAGVAAANHDIVAFVDDDVVVTPHWRAAIAAGFDDPAVGCATGLVLPLELETAAQEEFEIYSQQRREFQRRVYSRQNLRSSAAGIVGVGANMAYRRSALREVGAFDVRLDAGTATRSGGETDMFARVLDAGWQIVYNPDAQVWHRHRRTTAELRSCVFGYGIGVYGMLTKRLLEQRDLGTLVTAARWLIGPPFKALRANVAGRPAPRWSVVLAETAGAACGPFCFWYETWRARGDRGSAT
jgi:GT2 family glycosyltransferase